MGIVPTPGWLGTSGAKRRRHGRIACQETRCTLGEILDISASGMRIRHRERVAIGELIGVTLQGDGNPVLVQARAVWSVKRGFWKQESGFVFEKLDGEAAEVLRQIARACAANETIRPDVEMFRRSA